MAILKASEIWRDYETDGVPASGPHQPVKRDVSQWGSTLESMLAQLGLGFATKAALDASLLYSANTLAMVYADSTAANNGIYVKSGTSGSGSWSRIGDLQISIIPLAVTGGTGNAIVATAPISPVNPAQHLYLLTPTANNTSATTIAVNGGSTVAIKNALNANLTSGSLIMGNAALMCWVTDHYQLLVAAAIDGNAILADAQAAAISAASSASAASGSAAAAAAAVNYGMNFATRTAAIAANIPGTVTHITTAGYTTVGDGGGSIATGAIYKRVGSLPGHSGYIHSADGAYWELTGIVSRFVSVAQFGAVAAVANLDTDPDCAAAINLCMAYCNLKQANMMVPSGQWLLDAAITSPTFIIEIRGSQGGGQPTVFYKRYVEADANKGMISLGAWGGTISDIQFAAKAGTSGGSALSAILPNNAANIGILRLRNIYVSCGDGVNASLHINGTVNTGGVGGTGGKSYRSVFLENCHFFGAAQYTILLLSVQHCYASNVFADATGGTTSSGVCVNCAGNSTAPNDDIFWTGIMGTLSLDWLTRAVFNCVVGGNLSNTANVNNVTVTRVYGTIGSSWVSSRVIN
ncbi:hypothetical protein IVB46_44275 [Bradyrhizobium sp. 61]|uniref:hypothetical protein n=1 Tax=Bradyrhizobium sp. 61 TaxID=2782679 RepID=UPI001FF78838|nr:hypothetical protein [Bradyrhizobium sp. 61]MCK1282255.1 hypothetical protein [Bradyrhizobium sp. 61]